MQKIVNEIILNIKLSNNKSLGDFLEKILCDNNEIFITFKVANMQGEIDSIINEIEDLKQIIIMEVNKKIGDKYKVYISCIKQSQDSKILNKTILPNIKNIIGIASGKGGVGKSTFTVNLAYALKARGLRVGILDGDIYGPSVAFMLGGETIDIIDGSYKDKIPVMVKDGIKYNSVATFLEDKDSAIVLKAPMIIKLFNQMLKDSNWGELDVLLIDLPPGTGDLHINLCLKIFITGIIMICTPQKLALLDAIKAINMYNQVSTNVLGMVENMSSFECPHCLEVSNIFDSKGVLDVAKEKSIDFLGSIPISLKLRELCDNNGNITELQDGDTTKENFFKIADKVVSKLV